MPQTSHPDSSGAPPWQNIEEKTEHLLRRIAALESRNTALLGKLVQAQKELAELKRPAADTLPKTPSTGSPVQTYGWERKLTRMGWRQP